MKKQSIKTALLAAMALTAVYSCAVDDYDKLGAYDFSPEGINLSGGDKFEEFKDNDFVPAAEQPVSTFSVDADGAAYAYMRRMVGMGVLPGKSSARIEEYLNYFTFNYPAPEGDADVAINSEVGPCPWNSGHYLMRLGVRGRDLEPGGIPVGNYVFLIDVSGSMASRDKLTLLQEGLTALVDQLNKDDRISIVTYSGEERKLLESTPVSQASRIKKAIAALKAEGYTAGAAGLKMAYEECLANFIKGGNNRVIMGTDGDFNVGVTSSEALEEMARSYARQGIYLTVCGFGTGNLNDAMMERVSNWGNGTYQYIDSRSEMLKVFVKERGKFFSVASDSKNQVTFDSEVVDSYRLIGYENRVMNKEDFEDDSKDAGEIGASQTITALYEIVPAPGFAPGKTVARYDFRYKKVIGGESVPLSMDVEALTPEKSSSNLSFAAAVASYGMILRKSEYAGSSSYEMSLSLIDDSLSDNGAGLDEFQIGLRKEFRSLVQKASEARE